MECDGVCRARAVLTCDVRWDLKRATGRAGALGKARGTAIKGFGPRESREKESCSALAVFVGKGSLGVVVEFRRGVGWRRV